MRKVLAALAILAGVTAAPLITSASAHADGWCYRTDGNGGSDCEYDAPHGGIHHHNTVCWSDDACQVFDYTD
jgi:hypothetical protein